MAVSVAAIFANAWRREVLTFWHRLWRVPAHLARLGITTREAEILRLVNAGLSNADIAEQLHISVRTVETHVSSMLQKTGTERRDQLPRW